MSKLDPLLRRMGEMISVKLTAGQRVMELVGLLNSVEEWKQKWIAFSSDGRFRGTVISQGDRESVLAGKSRNWEKLEEFLQWNERWIEQMESNMREVAKSAEADARMHGTMVDDLLDDMMNVLMLPCSTVLEIFPRIVRDRAPTARRTPISLVRSMTPMERAPISAMPPTRATITERASIM